MSSHKTKRIANLKIEDSIKEEYIDAPNIKLEEGTYSTSSQQSKDEDNHENHEIDDRSPNSNKNNGKKATRRPNSKHIIKNYGKGMCTFACSRMAKPYLQDILKDRNIRIQDFQNHIKRKRKTIDSMKSIRDLLLVKKDDDTRLRAYKEIFQRISIIFIKYFSVNWIFQGKMSYKQAHVNARFKMLRRIKNPEHFTYFRDFTKY